MTRSLSASGFMTTDNMYSPFGTYACAKGGEALEGIYDIFLGEIPVGKVEVERQGLYYRFDCRCKLTDDGMYRLMVECDGHHENLGIPMPSGGEFRLTRKLAAKRLGKGYLSFRALPKHQEQGRRFVPVYPEEPFAYITRLQDAFLEVRNGQVGVMIR